MQTFIVLGIVPGTNIQLDFSFWLSVAIGFISLLCLPRIILAASNLRRQLIIRQVARRIDHLEMLAI